MERYLVKWSNELVTHSEGRLQLIYGAVKQFLLEVNNGNTEKKANDAAGAVHPCGSFLLRTNVHNSPYGAVQMDEGLGMDMLVTMPETSCSLEDVQDGLYLQKRQAFVMKLHNFLEGNLRKLSAAADSTKEPADGKTAHKHEANILVALAPFRHDSTKHIIRITFLSCCSQVREPFHVDVHVRSFMVGARIGSEKGVAKHSLYSQYVLEDFLMADHLKKLHEACLSSQVVVRTVIFMKAWAAHVGISGSTYPSCLNGFLLSAMVVHLLESGIITASMSDENMVRAVWVQIARGTFLQGGVPTLKFNGEALNVLFRVNGTYFVDIVKTAAESALKLKASSDVFSQRSATLELCYDVALVLRGAEQVSSDISATVKVSGAKETRQSISAKAIEKVIQTALGERRLQSSLVWVDNNGNGTVLINVKSEQEARSKISVGPFIEDADGVKAFDAFWGSEMTSTRQFPDGSINRCVAWNIGRQSVIPPIIQVTCHILQVAFHKHVLSSLSVAPLLGSLDGFVMERVGEEYQDVVSLTEAQLRNAVKFVTNLFENLPSHAMPCKVSSFDVVSAAARGCDPFATRPHVALVHSTTDITQTLALSVAPTIEPINCVLSIDDKHKIPDTIDAIQMMKGAICAQISKSIQTTIGAKVKTLCTGHSVDVIYEGYFFRVYVAHYREVSLLRALQRDAEANLIERKLFWTGRHGKFVTALALGHQTFGMACRLAKRWVSAMLLGEFLLPEAIELLVADAYLSEHPPRSALKGFVHFLQLVADHNWKQALVLPTVDPAEVVQDGKHDGMWIAAPYAPESSPFTLNTPKPMIIHRLTALCRSVLRTLSSLLRGGGCGAAIERLLESSVFNVDESDFDVVIPLSKELQLMDDRNIVVSADSVATSNVSALRRFWRLDELTHAESQKYIHQLVELEPASHCIRKLRARTRDRCMIFADSLGPNLIAAVLLSGAPTAAQCRQLRDDLVAMGEGALVARKSDPSVHDAPTKRVEHRAVNKDKAAKKSAPEQKQASAQVPATKKDARPAEPSTEESASKKKRTEVVTNATSKGKPTKKASVKH